MASRYSNQHSLALDKMSVSSECFYQPRVQSDFDADAESLDQQLGKSFSLSLSLSVYYTHVFLQILPMHFRSVMLTSLSMCLLVPLRTKPIG